MTVHLDNVLRVWKNSWVAASDFGIRCRVSAIQIVNYRMDDAETFKLLVETDCGDNDVHRGERGIENA